MGERVEAKDTTSRRRAFLGENYCCPLHSEGVGADQLSLFQHGLRRLLLLIGRVAMLAQNAPDNHANLRARCLVALILISLTKSATARVRGSGKNKWMGSATE